MVNTTSQSISEKEVGLCKYHFRVSYHVISMSESDRQSRKSCECELLGADLAATAGLPPQHHRHRYEGLSLEGALPHRRRLPTSGEGGWEGIPHHLHRGRPLEGQSGHPDEPANCCPPWTGQCSNPLLRSPRSRWSCSTSAPTTAPGSRVSYAF